MTKFNSLAFRDNQIVKVDRLLDVTDFDSLEDLQALYPNIGDTIIFVTPEAWAKCEDLLTPAEGVEHSNA